MYQSTWSKEHLEQWKLIYNNFNMPWSSVRLNLLYTYLLTLLRYLVINTFSNGWHTSEWLDIWTCFIATYISEWGMDKWPHYFYHVNPPLQRANVAFIIEIFCQSKQLYDKKIIITYTSHRRFIPVLVCSPSAISVFLYLCLLL